MSPPFNTVAEQEREIVRVAHRILDSSVGIIAGAREMTRVQFRSHSKDSDADYLFFEGLDSETGHLPVGEVRKHWSSEALARKDAEITEAEELYRPRALEAARNLIQRYEQKQNPPARGQRP